MEFTGKGQVTIIQPTSNYPFPFTIMGIGVKPFLGGIPFGSAIYGPTGGVVNAGLTISKSIKISREYDLPVFGSIICKSPGTERLPGVRVFIIDGGMAKQIPITYLVQFYQYLIINSKNYGTI